MEDLRINRLAVSFEVEDLRINRLAVSLCEWFGEEFCYVQVWDYNLRYFGLFDKWRNIGRAHPIDALTIFFRELYNNDEGTFASLLSRFFRKVGGKISQGIEQELNTLGYTFSDKEYVRPLTGNTKVGIEIKTEIDNKLEKLDPSFSIMRRGAWETLTSNHNDKERQAVTSMRELIKKAIDKIVPDDGLSQKQKLKKILSSDSESELELVSSIIDVVENLLKFHSKGTHYELSFEQAMYALLISEYTLYYLLNQ